MQETPATVSQQAVRGVASGVLFMAFFGTLWSGVGVMGLQGWGERWITLAALIVGSALLIGGIFLFRSSRRLLRQVAASDQQGNRTNMWFGIIFAAEGIAIALASVICNAVDRLDIFFPVTAFIVGVHFLPLAALFHVKPYYLVGILLCFLASITLLAVPQHADLAGHAINAQLVMLGFGAALILWSVGVGLLLLGTKLLGAVPH